MEKVHSHVDVGTENSIGLSVSKSFLKIHKSEKDTGQCGVLASQDMCTRHENHAIIYTSWGEKKQDLHVGTKH